MSSVDDTAVVDVTFFEVTAGSTNFCSDGPVVAVRQVEFTTISVSDSILSIITLVQFLGSDSGEEYVDTTNTLKSLQMDHQNMQTVQKRSTPHARTDESQVSLNGRMVRLVAIAVLAV